VLRGVFYCALLTVSLIPASVAAGANDPVAATLRTSPPLAAVQPAPSYSVSVGLDGEIFPMFANYAALQKPEQRRWGTVAVIVRNSSSVPLRNRITVEVPGWSDQEIQVAEMRAGEVRTYLFAPTFLPRLYRNREIAAATAVVNVTGMGGQELFHATVPVRLRSVEDMYWGVNFKYAPFIASWITPHDPRVEQILSQAKEFAPRRRLPGYETGKSKALVEQSTVAQAKAIYRALQQQGVSYVNSSLTFGGNKTWSERVRPPRESLRIKAANCIDGALLYAALFENLGMDALVLLVPGHAYVGVRLAPSSDRYLYIETSYTGRAPFEDATRAAERSLAKYSQSQMTLVRIAEARRAGIYPMPE
jgi:transglutaminase-like putative cysteine protease